MEDAPSGYKPHQSATEKQSGNTPSYLMSPNWRLSPGDKASTLYDSFELRAVAKQLNRAIQGTNGPLSPYSRYLNSSPFYSKQLNRIRRRSANTPKKISCSQLEVTAKNTKGFVMRLWMKVKCGLNRAKGKDSQFCG